MRSHAGALCVCRSTRKAPALRHQILEMRVSVSLFDYLVCPTLFHQYIFRLYACFQSINRHFTLTPSGVLQE